MMSVAANPFAAEHRRDALADEIGKGPEPGLLHDEYPVVNAASCGLASLHARARAG